MTLFPIAIALLATVSTGIVLCIWRRTSKQIRELRETLTIESDSKKETLHILDSILDGLVAFDSRWRIQYINPKAEQYLDRSRREFLEILPEAQSDDILSLQLNKIKTAAVTLGRTTFEAFHESSGKWYEFHVYSSEKRVSVLFSDITLRKREVEEKRVDTSSSNSSRVKNMETLGNLTSGITHDFKNILSIMGLHCESALSNSSASPATLMSVIREISQLQEKAAWLSRRILDFGKCDDSIQTPIDLKTVLSESIHALRRMIREDIHFWVSISEDLGAVCVDRHQFEQALINLVLNARDALPEGGNIWISASNLSLNKEAHELAHTLKPGPYVFLSVEDDGVGMTSDAIDRIFDRFYSTKEPDRGTGLGLSRVKEFVDQSRGTILVRSEPEHGTQFRIFLPRAQDLKPADRRTEPSVALDGCETILLVEDEPDLREAIGNQLRNKGYTVLFASNGNEGLGIFKDQLTSIHMVITDVIMPQMGGRNFVQEIRKIDLKIPILFISGYSESYIEREAPHLKDYYFLEKPFDTETLLKKIRSLLPKNTPY